MRCPKCSYPLEEVQLPERVTVDCCPHCFGAFYDRSELAVTIELSGVVETSWSCPKCGGSLKTGRYRGELGLERCDQCWGVWFDSGEVQKLRKASGVEGVVAGPGLETPAPLMPPAAADAFVRKLEEQRAGVQAGFKAKVAAGDEAKDSRFPEIPDGSSLPNPDERDCPVAQYQGRAYQHFQTSAPVVTFVVGEFPWQVKVGEKARARDFICPPYVLSQEVSGKESVWSHGEYLEPEEVWAAFKLKDTPADRKGIAPAQPNPHDEGWPALSISFWTFSAAAMAVALALGFSSQNKTVLETGYQYAPAAAEKAVVTEAFELGGHASNVEVAVNALLNNQWAYLSMALINADTDTALDFGREISFYSGSDSDGAWSEGSPSDTAILPRVPPGRYYLRIEPETDTGAFPYSVRVRRDVPQPSLAATALVLLALPMLWVWWRRRVFEHQRWLESDHPWSTESDDDDE